MTIPIRLFQVADVPLANLYAQQWHGYRNDFAVAPRQVLWGERTIFGENQYRPSPKTIGITGTLIPDNGATVDNKINRLTHYGGKEVDIIAYTFAACCSNFGCCSCEPSWSSDELLWLHTRGAINDVSATENNGTFNIAVGITLSTAWEALNMLTWEWTTGRSSIFAKQPYNAESTDGLDGTLIRPYPTWKNIGGLCQYGIFNKRVYLDEFYTYKPEHFPYIHTLRRPTFPYTTGIGYDWNERGGMDNQYLIHANEEIWSARPASLYMFTAFSGADIGAGDEIELSVTNAQNVWESHTLVASLDLNQLDTDLQDAGYPGLRTWHIIVAGYILRMPSYIIDTSSYPWEILTDVYPKWDYRTEWVGQLDTGSNRLRIRYPQTENGDTVPKHAMLHNFRRL